MYGYMRVSSKVQGSRWGLQRQQKQLLDYGIDKKNLIHDEISGSNRSRKGLNHLLDVVCDGDTVVVVSLDRLGRNVVDCLNLIQEFRDKNVDIVFLKENINTSNNDAMTNAFIAIASAFAQLEKERMLERVEETKAAMKEKGLDIGRPRVDQDKLDAAVSMYLEGKGSYRAISKIVGISPAKICLAVNDTNNK